MKRTIKKWSIAILSLVLAISCLMMCACGKKDPPEFNIEKSTLQMIVFDDYLLNYEVKNTEETIIWTSSDDAIVSVSDGKLTAKKEGTATITATVSGLTDTCVVTVIKTDFRPELYVCEEQEIFLIKNGTYTFNPIVYYKNEPSEATFSYYSNDKSVADITTDGTITAKAHGQAIISVSANFKGFEIMKTIIVTVAPVLGGEVMLNGNAITNQITISTTDVVNLTVRTFLDAEPDDTVQVTWTKDDDNSLTEIQQTGKDLRVTANKPGSITLKATYTKGADSFDTEYTVNIIKKVFERTEEVFVSKKSKVEGQTAITLPNTIDVSTITNVKVGNLTKEVLSYDSTANTVTIDPTELPVGEIIVGFETNIYNYSFINATVADVVITNITTLEYMGNDMLAKETEGKYYVLAQDVSFGGYQWPASWPTDAGKAAYFGGTFDGRGHKIYNMQMRYGLFNDISKDGTVKNLIVDLDNKGASNNGAISKVCHGTIDNCMVITKITAGENNPTVLFAGVATRIGATGKVNNCVVHITSYTPYATDEPVRLKAIAHTVDVGATISNCYAVSAFSDHMYGEVKTGLYASVSEFLQDVTSLSEDDGWNGYWKIITNDGENNGLYFNNVKVM